MILPDSVARLAAAFRKGKRPALARAISVVEGGRPGAGALLHELLLVRPQARRFGITGPPGAGKSTLAAGLATLLRERGEAVAIVAVDPTSPFSGGALLGDRIRMNDLATDRGVFIRSMATRGSLGGLAARTREVIDLLDAFGFPNVLVETVGVGQTELEIASAVDSVAVVLVPESGDGIQTMKAGLMEIADLFVVNKSDRPGADRLVRDIRQAIRLRAGRGMAKVPAHHGVDLGRTPDAATPGRGVYPGGPSSGTGGRSLLVLKTSAEKGEGIAELLDGLIAHNRQLARSDGLEERRRRRARERIRDVVEERLRWRAADFLASDARIPGRISEIAAGRATAYGVADEIIPAILKRVPKLKREDG